VGQGGCGRQAGGQAVGRLFGMRNRYVAETRAAKVGIPRGDGRPITLGWNAWEGGAVGWLDLFVGGGSWLVAACGRDSKGVEGEP